jgi:hypothetical protein
MAEPAYNFGALEERVSGLEHGISDVRASIDGLAREVRDRQKFPWPAIWGGMSVLLVIIGMFGAIVVWGFNSYLTSLQSTLSGLQTQVVAIDQGIVPRGEHQERWRAQEASVANVQREVDQMRNDFGSSFSLNDTLKALMERVDRLEQIRLEQSP